MSNKKPRLDTCATEFVDGLQTSLAAAQERVKELELINKNLCEDWASDDTAIRDFCRPHLGNERVTGDKWHVPPMVDLVEALANELDCLKAQLKERENL